MQPRRPLKAEETPSGGFFGSFFKNAVFASLLLLGTLIGFLALALVTSFFGELLGVVLVTPGIILKPFDNTLLVVVGAVLLEFELLRCDLVP